MSQLNMERAAEVAKEEEPFVEEPPAYQPTQEQEAWEAWFQTWCEQNHDQIIADWDRWAV